MNAPVTPAPDGPYVEYFKNGSGRCAGTYQNGLRTGGWRTWDEAGQLIKTTRHKSS